MSVPAGKSMKANRFAEDREVLPRLVLACSALKCQCHIQQLGMLFSESLKAVPQPFEAKILNLLKPASHLSFFLNHFLLSNQCEATAFPSGFERMMKGAHERLKKKRETTEVTHLRSIVL